MAQAALGNKRLKERSSDCERRAGQKYPTLIHNSALLNLPSPHLSGLLEAKCLELLHITDGQHMVISNPWPFVTVSHISTSVVESTSKSSK